MHFKIWILLFYSRFVLNVDLKIRKHKKEVDWEKLMQECCIQNDRDSRAIVLLYMVNAGDKELCINNNRGIHFKDLTLKLTA